MLDGTKPIMVSYQKNVECGEYLLWKESASICLRLGNSWHLRKRNRTKSYVRKVRSRSIKMILKRRKYGSIGRNVVRSASLYMLQSCLSIVAILFLICLMVKVASLVEKKSDNYLLFC